MKKLTWKLAHEWECGCICAMHVCVRRLFWLYTFVQRKYKTLCVNIEHIQKLIFFSGMTEICTLAIYLFIYLFIFL